MESVWFCRKVGFWRPNPKIGYQKINDLRVLTFLFSVICDRAAFSACSPHRPHLDSVKPIRSADSYSPPLPRSDSTLDARATPESTGCDYPFSSLPSAAWPGLHESAACAGTYHLAY